MSRGKDGVRGSVRMTVKTDLKAVYGVVNQGRYVTFERNVTDVLWKVVGAEVGETLDAACDGCAGCM